MGITSKKKKTKKTLRHTNDDIDFVSL